jgi:hypothetical protein
VLKIVALRHNVKILKICRFDVKIFKKCLITVKIFKKSAQTTRSHLFTLIGGDSEELRFLEDHGAEGAPRDFVDVVALDDMDSWLVTVHRVQDRL